MDRSPSNKDQVPQGPGQYVRANDGRHHRQPYRSRGELNQWPVVNQDPEQVQYIRPSSARSVRLITKLSCNSWTRSPIWLAYSAVTCLSQLSKERKMTLSNLYASLTPDQMHFNQLQKQNEIDRLRQWHPQAALKASRLVTATYQGIQNEMSSGQSQGLEVGGWYAEIDPFEIYANDNDLIPEKVFKPYLPDFPNQLEILPGRCFKLLVSQRLMLPRSLYCLPSTDNFDCR